MISLRLPQRRDPVERIRDLVENLSLLQSLDPEIDVSDVSYVTPLTILPLAAFITKYLKKPKLDSKNTRSIEHLSSISFPNGVDLSCSDNCNPAPQLLAKIPLGSQNNSFILNRIAEDYTNHIVNFLQSRGEASVNYQESISYFLSEIVDNICTHSEASSCWMFFRFWKSRGELEFCILDDGIGIKRSYDKSGMGIKDHLDALEQAVRGVSTRSEHRGFGIGSNIKLFTSSEARGEACIISGNACYLASHSGLRKLGFIPIYWHGVIFSIRLTRPLDRISVTNYVST